MLVGAIGSVMTNEPKHLTPAEQKIIDDLIAEIDVREPFGLREGEIACRWYEVDSDRRLERGVQQTLSGELVSLKDNLSYQLKETLKNVKLIEGWISLVQAELDTAWEDES